MKMLVNHQICQQKMACFFGQSANLILPLTKKIDFTVDQKIEFTVDQKIDFTVDQKIDFLSMPIDFYYTSNKRTCLHLQNVLFFKKFYFGQCRFFFWSTHNSVNRDATIIFCSLFYADLK